jgi:CDP-diacylglycerol pyrophosphatase
MRPSRLALVFALVAGALFAANSARADRNALWRIVHEQCVPAAAKGEALPPPCLSVAKNDAVIKDRNGIAQLLEIPTAKITGIEDPQVLAPGAPNYFADAWAQRGLMDRYLPKPPPREALSITVNSEVARSQDQLHLHVDCLSPESAKTLADYAPHIDGEWRPMTETLAGRRYYVRRIADLETVNPFRVLAQHPPAPSPAMMGQWTLAAVPLTFDGKPGFALLADTSELTAGGHAEDIQDHDCALAR